MSRDFKEQIRAFFQGVKTEDFEQKVKEFNDLKNKKTNTFSIALGTANFEAYKSEYLNRINSPYSDKKAIIESLKNKTKKLLEKREDIYNQIRLNNEVTIFLVDPFDKYHYYTKKHEIIELMKFEEYLIEQENIKYETDKPDESYKTKLWFKVGLLFAKGEMNKYFMVTDKNETIMKNGFTAPKIARELGNESYNKYILATINNYTPDNGNGSKNIFNSFDMMSKIIAHCEAENITVDTYFKSRLLAE